MESKASEVFPPVQDGGCLMRPLVVFYWHYCLLYCQNLRAFLSEFLFYQLLHPAFFGIWYGVHLPEVALLGLQRGVETKDVSCSNKIDDSSRRKSVYLMVEYVQNAFTFVGDFATHFGVVEQPPHYLRDVQP